VFVAETNYFFRLSAYQERIEEWLASGRVCIRPEKRRVEILRFVRSGLQDISISRLASRSGGRKTAGRQLATKRCRDSAVSGVIPTGNVGQDPEPCKGTAIKELFAPISAIAGPVRALEHSRTRTDHKAAHAPVCL